MHTGHPRLAGRLGLVFLALAVALPLTGPTPARAQVQKIGPNTNPVRMEGGNRGGGNRGGDYRGGNPGGNRGGDYRGGNPGGNRGGDYRGGNPGGNRGNWNQPRPGGGNRGNYNQPRPGGGHYDGRNYQKNFYYGHRDGRYHYRGSREVYIDRLPPYHRHYDWRGSRYYYYGGHFYRPRGTGFFLVAPPIGLIIGTLPWGYSTVFIGGVTYYSYMGVYYRPAPMGYVVVTPPAVVEAPPPETLGVPEPGTVVVVVSNGLNVRQGPSYQHAVIAVANQGDQLVVQASAPGWLYVQLPDGILGWVDQRYTAPLAPPANG
ncbi:MAG: SH3 domain-containing protein [Deltaproteobacteria bacterium]|nr:SH3 domain-containing protein [Deltaproteobacteria bacterium]